MEFLAKTFRQPKTNASDFVMGKNVVVDGDDGDDDDDDAGWKVERSKILRWNGVNKHCRMEDDGKWSHATKTKQKHIVAKPTKTFRLFGEFYSRPSPHETYTEHTYTTHRWMRQAYAIPLCAQTLYTILSQAPLTDWNEWPYVCVGMLLLVGPNLEPKIQNQ